MVTVVSGILMLGVLVFIHEFGHFSVAKLTGVKVLKFSLGFGPRLFSYKWGETEYQLCLIPLGGYVQMLGEGVGETEEETEQPLTAEERQRSFAHKSIQQRMAIVAAGPVMNLLLPLLLLPLAYMVGVNVPAYLDEPACIGYVVDGSEAQRAGFVVGDCIEAVNNVIVPTWSSTDKALIPNVGGLLKLSVKRSDEIVQLQFPPENGSLEGLQSLGLLPQQDAVVGSLRDNMPAVKVGMQGGDRIVKINSTAITSWYDLHTVIQDLAGEKADFTVLRNGNQLHFNIVAQRDDAKKMWLIGISPQQNLTLKQYSVSGAIKTGFKRTFELVDLTLVFLRKMVSGHVSAANIGGPIMVMQIAGQAVQTDFSTILTVLSFLSIQLGILNLLPIPVLDGGHLFFNFIELIMKKPVSLRTREMMQQLGLGLLLMLMLLAFYNDIVRIFL